MAKKVKFPPPKEDVPAWFMTYSDVITLLMTFFILLLTFATTEPERFDQVTSTISVATAGQGITGDPLKNRPEKSWVHRIRPPSSRIAIRGAEMPPIMAAPSGDSVGQGLKALEPDEDKHNEMSAHFFDIEWNRLLNETGELTPHAKQIFSTLAIQLNDLPFQASLQFTDTVRAGDVIRIHSHIIREEMVRPGQISTTRIHDERLTNKKLRIMIKRFQPQ